MAAEAIERQLDNLVRRQHGVFTRRQAIDLGFTGRMVDRRVAIGAWLRLGPGVYAHPSHAFTWKRQLKAAELSVRGSAVSHRAAAVLHDLHGVRPGGIDLTVAPSGSARSPLATVHRRQSIPAAIIDGIRVTTRSRTIVDLAARVPMPAFESLLDDALVRRRVRIDEIVAEYQRLAPDRVRGIGVVGDLLRAKRSGRPPAANELERALAKILADPRVPPSRAQNAFPWWPDGPYRVDAFIPTWRRIIEADGRLWHSREQDFDRDRWRDHLAQRHGYEVTRFSYRQLVVEPNYALGVLLDIGRRRAA